MSDPTWTNDIKPMFDRYVKCMKQQKNLDLGNYEVVKSKAELILQMISIIPPSTVPRMPPDGALEPDQVKLFERWIATGYKE